jgi:hypothetical protein
MNIPTPTSYAGLLNKTISLSRPASDGKLRKRKNNCAGKRERASGSILIRKEVSPPITFAPPLVPSQTT